MLFRMMRLPSRTRGFNVAIVLILAVLLVQIAATTAGAVLSHRELSNAQQDTLGYVGDLTASEVGRFADEATGVVNSSAAQYETEMPDSDTRVDAAATAAYLRLRDNPAVRALYIGWPGGGYFYLVRDGEGFRQVSRQGLDEPSQVVRMDADGQAVGLDQIDSGYDPRSRPWYQAALTSEQEEWTEPFVQFGSNARTLVTVARAARDSHGELLAIIGADVSTDLLTGVLDDLPYGDAAEGFVLADGQRVVAAPSEYAAAITAFIERTGDVPTARDLGVDVAVDAFAAGETSIADADGVMALTREVEDQRPPWWIHLSTPVAALSGGLGALQSIAWWSTALTLVVTGVALAILWSVRHPLKRLQRAASTDALTGLANRDALLRRGVRLLQVAADRGEAVLVAMIDLDHFKQVNDQFGHAAGDEVLAAVALAMQRHTRAGDVVARAGGDEFVVVMAVRAGEEPHAIAARLRDEVERAVKAGAVGADAVGVTMGVVHGEAGRHGLEALMGFADDALVRGKQIAKGRVYTAVPVDERDRRSVAT